MLAFPAERERWFTYRSDLLHFHIQTWIEHMKIEVGAPPPWGRVAVPEEPVELTRPTSSGEAPGEILRRQARDLLDEIPAAELPSALVFLEFLRDRGASPLLAGPSKRVESRIDRLSDEADLPDDLEAPEPEAREKARESSESRHEAAAALIR